MTVAAACALAGAEGAIADDRLEPRCLADCPTVEFGSYPQTKEGDVLPLEWYVVAEEGDRKLLLSKYAVDCRAFNKALKGAFWEDCDLRYWLNGEFARTAFSEEERSRIAPSILQNDDNPLYRICRGQQTVDRVFCLSIGEVLDQLALSQEDRVAMPTDYAKAKGINCSGGPGVVWWLRSSGDSSTKASLVYFEGSVDDFGDWFDYKYYGVRPALWMSAVPTQGGEACDGMSSFGCEGGGVVLEAEVSGMGDQTQTMRFGMTATWRGAMVKQAKFTLWPEDAQGFYLPMQSIEIDMADGALAYSEERFGEVPLNLPPEAVAVECQRIECVVERGLAGLPAVEFGSYPQAADGDVLPIVWRVLAEEGGMQLLLTDQVLECMPFNDERVAVSWETSPLRAWLNAEFAQEAFSDEEMKSLVRVELESSNADYDVVGEHPTNDRVFCLSLDEVERYLGAQTSRRVGVEYGHLVASPTDYVRGQGVYVNGKSDGCTWWLRSPGDRSSFACCVSSLGLVRSDGGAVETATNAVRPALWRRVG